MKRLLILILTFIGLTSFEDPDGYLIKILPKLKSITERQELNDTFVFKQTWTKNFREYYPNGQLKAILFISTNSDTTRFKFLLNKDSVIKSILTFNTKYNKWETYETFTYKNNNSCVGKTKFNNTEYLYSSDHKLLRWTHKLKNNVVVDQYDYIYDTTRTISQVLRYFYTRDLSSRPTGIPNNLIDISEFNKENTLENCFVEKKYFMSPDLTILDKRKEYLDLKLLTSEEEKTKAKVSQKIFYNKKGEIAKKITFTGNGQIYATSTFIYEYYK